MEATAGPSRPAFVLREAAASRQVMKEVLEGEGMKCPRCHEETSDDGLNCTACHINLYWARYHLNALTELRESQGIGGPALPPPAFLVKAHDDAVAEREKHPEAVASKVRTFRRRVGEAQA